jgi:hypothetical protein
MISVSGKVADRNLCAGNTFAYQFFDLMSVHSHAKTPAVSSFLSLLFIESYRTIVERQ